MKKDINKSMKKIIKLGWVPWGIYTSLIVGMELVRCEEYTGSSRNRWCSYRELVSKESGLRQFCIENNLIDYSNVRAYGIGFNLDEKDNQLDRLLWDCASKYESELENFILSVIKI